MQVHAIPSHLEHECGAAIDLEPQLVLGRDRLKLRQNLQAPTFARQTLMLCESSPMHFLLAQDSDGSPSICVWHNHNLHIAAEFA